MARYGQICTERQVTDMACKHYFKEWIKHRVMTQRRVAERMAEFYDSGFSETTLSRLINDKLIEGFNRKHLEGLAFALNCLPDELLRPPPTTNELELARQVKRLKPSERRQVLKIIEAIKSEETAA